MKNKRIFTLEDMVHYVIFRELDKLKISNAYKIAEKICEELKATVTYRKTK